MVVAEDVHLLQHLGYAQELKRRMSGFSNFAISFSIICILSGGITSMHQSVSGLGGFAIGVGWPVGCLFAYLIALALAQLASAYPTAGGLYHWSAFLAGHDAAGRPRVWGWATAWFNLIGLIAVLTAINVATYDCLVTWLGPELGLSDAQQAQLLSPGLRLVSVGLITFSQACCNHLGIRATSLMTDFSGYLILLVTTALVATVLYCAPRLHLGPLFDPRQNFSGASGGGVWPRSGALWLFALGLLHPAYSLTGFDASAHTAEETIGASRTVPVAIRRSVLYASLAGWILLVALVLAIDNVALAARQGERVFPWLMERLVPAVPRRLLYLGMLITQYLCGLATVTSGSRMMYAFARDGGLPRWLAAVSGRYGTPARAIWTGVAASGLLALVASSGRAYEAMAATATMFLYISYVLPIAMGWFALRRGTWRQMGPYVIFGRRWGYLVVAPLCVSFSVLLLAIGGYANPHARWLLGSGIALALIGWLGHQRRHFQGPPQRSRLGTEVQR
jgi:amino acid transporter